MAKVKVREIKDFTGGLNFRADQFQLKDNESPDMLNVEIDPRGGVFSRGGQRRLNGTAISGTWAPKRLVPFYGTTPTLMLATATKLYRCTSDSFSTLQYSSGNDITCSSGKGADVAQWGKTLYIVNGSSSVGYKWETADTYATALTANASGAWQTDVSTQTHIPKSDHIIVHANKMFVASTNENSVSYPNRLRWSIENGPASWDEDDYIDIQGGGDGITALAVVSGNLVIFKPNAIYVLFGYSTANFQVVELSATLGVDSKRHVAVTEKGIFFYVRKQGIYFYNGSSLEYLFENIKPIFDANYVNNSNIESISLSWVGQRIWLSLPYSTSSSGTESDSTTNFVFDPSINNGSYTLFKHQDDKGLVSGCEWTDNADNDYRLMMHPTLPRVIIVDLYEENSDRTETTDVSFTSYYKTKWQDGGNYVQKKMWRRPDFVVKETISATSIAIKVYHDFAEGEGQHRRTFNVTQTPNVDYLVWNNGNWGEEWAAGVVSSIVLTGNNLGLARTVQIEFTGPVGQKWGLNSIGYKYQARNTKG
jgi:hypothetical protein